MSITAVIMAIVGIVSAIFGALIMRPIAKSSGVKEGVQRQAEVQVAEQAKATVQAVQERVSVEKTVSTDNDSALNDRLSRYDRAE